MVLAIQAAREPKRQELALVGWTAMAALLALFVQEMQQLAALVIVHELSLPQALPRRSARKERQVVLLARPKRRYWKAVQTETFSPVHPNREA